jgi:uncharacterized protein with HEPN domain
MAGSDDECAQDIISRIADIRTDMTGLDFAAFTTKPTIIRSVLHSIAIMVEAAKGISHAFKSAHPDMTWRAIAGLRDKFIHEYVRTNTGRIWDVVTSDIDELEKSLRHPSGHPPSAD